MQEIAERDFGFDEIRLTIDIQKRTRKFLVDGLGEDGENIFDEFSGADFPDDLSGVELVQRLKERTGVVSFRLACYLAAGKWSTQGVLRDAGATRETFEEAWRETYKRLFSMLGKKKANRAWEMTTEFLETLGR
jgi:hypothetical protein